MSRTIKDIQYDLIKLFMKGIILSKLSKCPVGGYDLIKFFHEKHKVLLSPGTIYSCLYSMERSNLIEVNYSEEKRTYRLTAKGKQLLEEFRKSKQTILDLAEKLLMDV